MKTTHGITKENLPVLFFPGLMAFVWNRNEIKEKKGTEREPLCRTVSEYEYIM